MYEHRAPAARTLVALFALAGCATDWKIDYSQHDAGTSELDDDAGTADNAEQSDSSGAEEAGPMPPGAAPTTGGPQGTERPDGCSPTSCAQPGGTCRDAGAGFSCECEPGFGGTRCENDLCAPNPCQNGGICAHAASGASCSCPTGFRGERCETDVNECAAANACTSPDYPCVETAAPGYTCRGRQADWPMPGSARVTRSYDTSVVGVVTDNVTKLIWQRDLPPSFPGCTLHSSTDGDSCTLAEAKQVCEDLVLAGANDWRLPTKIELESILDYSVTVPAIDQSVFGPTATRPYWTGSTYRDSLSNLNYIVIFTNGGVASQGVGGANGGAAVRCVRGGLVASSMPAARYSRDSAMDTVTDNRTGLVWQATMDSGSYDWTGARVYCHSLRGTFRLPTIQELFTLVNPTSFNPAIDASAFPDAPTGVLLWSDTLYPAKAGAAWAMSAADGSALNPPTTGSYRVRCVK
jgi:hypothetical protein